MHKWTDDAKRELENYLQQVAKLSTARGDDSQEIVEGLRDHITHEAETNADPFITAERVRLILAQLGSAEEVVGVEVVGTETSEASEATSSDRNENHPANQDDIVLAKEVTAQELYQQRFGYRRKNPYRTGNVLTFLVIGVAFCAIFLGFCLQGGMERIPLGIRENFMPTLYHIWGLLLVPLAILYCFLTIRHQRRKLDQKPTTSKKKEPHPWSIRVSLILSGYVIVVSIYYSIACLPLTPLAAAATMMLIGIVGFAPYFTLITGFVQAKSLWRQAKKLHITPHWIWLGVIFASVTFGGWLIHHSACENAIEMATSENASIREQGIQKLKQLGGEPKVLAGCYDVFPHPFFISFRHKLSRNEFQTLYYRLTGIDYRVVARPAIAGPQGRNGRWNDWAIESEIGGSVVGARVPGLSLNSSTIDAVVAGDRDAKNAGPCVAYVQWVLEFKNASSRQREARCQIQMPPGSVGSRLTLWINGEEQEAAFGKRATVKKAYKEVAVRQRRDPALLTTDGADRLLLQCFPIEPHSKMKVKIGMSIPLTIRNFKITPQKTKASKTNPQEYKAILRLPYMADRNFTIARDFNHNVWAEGVAPMHSPTLETEQPKESHFAIRGKLTESELRNSAKAIIMLDAPELAKTLYTAELHGFSGTDILAENQPFELEDRSPARTVAIVVDTSRVCKESLWGSGFNLPSSTDSSRKRINWDTFFKSAPSGIDFSLFVGKNSKEHLSAKQASKAIVELLAEAPFDAADEQTGNLEKAWDLCAKSTHGLVLWVHGPMPVELASYDSLTQRMTRRPGHFGGVNPRIASVQIVPGPNLIEQNLDSATGMFRVPIFGSVQETLDDVAKNLNRPGLIASRLEFNFHADPLEQDAETKDASQDASPEPPTAKGSDQIVRIALGQKVYRESQTTLKGDEKQQLASEAAKLRLITPLTGAVVLEQASQYAKHGLDPDANVEATSDIPEPETWVLLIAIFVAFILMVRRRRYSLAR